MNQDERVEEIIQYLHKNNRMYAKEICELYHVSPDTARRDIVKLKNMGLVDRTHGGIIRKGAYESLHSFTNRENENDDLKKIIGEKAAHLVEENDFIYIDVSTTTTAMVHFLEAKNVKVLTNSIDVLHILMDKPNIEVNILGGQVDKKMRFVSGYENLDFIKGYHFNKVFVSAVGVDSTGIFYSTKDEVYFKKQLLNCTDQLILLADYSKFDKKHHYKCFDLSDIDIIVADKFDFKKDFLALVDEHEIELI